MSRRGGLQTDPKTLKTLGLSHTDMKNFGMALSPDGKTVYVTNSLDGGLSALNTADGKVKNRVLFPERNAEGFPYGARRCCCIMACSTLVRWPTRR